MRFYCDSVCFTLLQDAAELAQDVVGVMTAWWSGYGRSNSRSPRTFLEHGDTQILLALRMSAAHHGLRPPLLCAVVTNCQNLDLAVILLETQAVHGCRATIQRNDIRMKDTLVQHEELIRFFTLYIITITFPYMTDFQPQCLLRRQHRSSRKLYCFGSC